MDSVTQISEPKKPSIDLVSLPMLLRQHWRLIISVTIVCTAMSIWGITGLKPRYRAQAVLLLNTRVEHLSDLKSVVSGPLPAIPDPNVARGEVEVLQGRLLAGRVIQQLGIEDSPDLEPHESLMQKIELLLGDRLGLPTASSTQPRSAERRLNDAIDAYLKRFEAFNDGRSFTLDLSYTSTDPERAALVVNTHADAYLADQRDLKHRAAERAAAWLQNEVGTLRAELEQKERVIRDLREEAGLIGSTGNGGAATALERQVTDLATALAKAQADIATHQYLGHQHEADLNRVLTELQRKRDQQARIGAKVEDLERDAQSTRSVYETLLSRLGQIQAQVGAEDADARLISPAAAPVLPSFPNLPLFSCVALIVSATLGTALAWLLETHRRRHITELSDLECIDLTVLEAIPYVSRRKRRRRCLADLLVDEPKSMLAEKIRALRGDIARLQRGKGPRVLAITSALPGEGKTVTSLLLGRSMAAAGLQVLLIECDLRRPTAARQIGLKIKGPGLVAALRDGVSLAAATADDPHSSMRLLGAEQSVERPQDLLGGDALSRLLTEARGLYDYVIVDTPPLGAVSDAVLVAPHADATFLVVRWQTTPLAAVKAVVSNLARYDLCVSGVVLNATDLKRATPPELASMYRAGLSYGHGTYAAPAE